MSGQKRKLVASDDDFEQFTQSETDTLLAARDLLTQWENAKKAFEQVRTENVPEEACSEAYAKMRFLGWTAKLRRRSLLKFLTSHKLEVVRNGQEYQIRFANFVIFE